ncbi:hypothetical protein [Pseudooceanicola lipolyticus]|uniref:hypothetical protein n=1 Tax=Pseudooceanicola lipolyticus TaxID=2029104 RepID=UPI001054380C|nr:hypothetical protein [Pseudooceanicola lipolyticus]
MKISRTDMAFGLRAGFAEPQDGFSFTKGPIPEAPDTLWQGTLSILSQPIVFSEEITKVYESDKYRIYPPIKYRLDSDRMDKNKSDKSTFLLPIYGKDPIEITRGLTIDAHVKLTPNKGVEYDALRVDYAIHGDLHRPETARLIHLIKNHSGQWWITERNASLPLEKFMRFSILKDSRPTPFIRHPDGGFISAWESESSIYKEVGLERPINSSIWQSVCEAFANGEEPDVAMNSVHDTLAAFVSFRDNIFVVSCAISMEMLEHSARSLSGRKSKEYGIKLLRNSILWNKKDEDVLKRLFTDRGHLSHGKLAPRLNASEREQHLSRYMQVLVETSVRYYNDHYLPRRIK